jgi:hypothetical protein
MKTGLCRPMSREENNPLFSPPPTPQLLYLILNIFSLNVWYTTKNLFLYSYFPPTLLIILQNVERLNSCPAPDLMFYAPELLCYPPGLVCPADGYSVMLLAESVLLLACTYSALLLA